ncbi:unnamed protein product [Brachionus calyciflorus]|uniref:Shisa N-terminal domain-containing protein n=1 Tax=Brachionus calyciflorus TaxID=104777 RepID=A0A813QFC8_9BILA|nr:unnamed protein product [Brachionus calyciflorus]
MGDPGNLERYCSSYYDRHGLYNDGFPCPTDKYCCQTPEGAKMCCSISTPNSFAKAQSSTQSSILLSTISNEFINRQKSFFIDTNQHHNHHQITSQSSLNFLISNSNILISICVALTILVILSGLLLICVCKCLNRSSSSNRTIKKNLDSRSSYSRNSNSTCSTSTSSQSPKTNQLTICCDEELEEHQKILSIDPSQVSSSNHSHRPPLSNDIMQKSLINPNLATLLAQSNLIKPAFSSGSSNIGLLNSHFTNSANTTQTSFLTNHLIENNLNDLADFCVNEEDDDFLVSTSSNLEFLKTHSLFNSTPLNYYPSLNQKEKKQNEQGDLRQLAQTEQTQSNADFRFSTFLPPIQNL